MKNLIETRACKVLATLLIAVTFTFSLVPRTHAGFVSSTITPTQERAQDMQEIATTLEKKAVSEKLAAMGYSTEEVQARLDQLSNEDLHAVATNLEAAESGGAAGLIVGIVIVALLIGGILYFLDKDVDVDVHDD